MKKIINNIVLLMLLAFTFYGCNNNIEEDEVTTELPTLVADESPVIGLWKLTAITAMGQNLINDCKAKDKIEVSANKTFTFTFHDEDNNCAIQMSTGTWKDNLNNTYNFTAAGDTQVFTLTSENLLTFSFQQDSESIVYSFKKD